jgi:hypothetical protein
MVGLWWWQCNVCSLQCTKLYMPVDANSQIRCHSHAVPLLLRVWIVSFPFDLHSVAVFD